LVVRVCIKAYCSLLLRHCPAMQGHK
jgi:hypothetical protein